MQPLQGENLRKLKGIASRSFAIFRYSTYQTVWYL